MVFDFISDLSKLQFLYLDNNNITNIQYFPPKLIYLSAIKNPFKENEIRQKLLSQCYETILAMNSNVFTDEEKFHFFIIKN